MSVLRSAPGRRGHCEGGAAGKPLSHHGARTLTRLRRSLISSSVEQPFSRRAISVRSIIEHTERAQLGPGTDLAIYRKVKGERGLVLPSQPPGRVAQAKLAGLAVPVRLRSPARCSTTGAMPGRDLLAR